MKNNDQEAKVQTATKTEGLAVDESQNVTHWVLGVWYVLFPCCMAFVMLTPVDVLQRYPQVVPYVDWMASWHPYVHRIGLTEISGRLADVNRFCAAVMWGLWTPLLVPLFVVMFIRDIPGGINNQVQHPTGKVPRWASTTNNSRLKNEQRS